MTKENWRRAWRLIRIAKRESLKAYQDVLFWGTGAVWTNPQTGECRHVPVDQIRLPNADQNLTVARMDAAPFEQPLFYGGRLGGGMSELGAK